ncbi:MAG TPA: hypothetical protein DCM62_05440 [Bacteroidales bacterium]|nr:hypothetical protein [Bacteroidales bacterium]
MNLQKKILMIGAGLLAGIIITGIISYKAAPGIMLHEAQSKYDFETAVQVFEQTALEMGWKIPVVHNMAEVMKNNGFNVRNMKVFELCYPAHAYEILSRDDERIVSNMMPCRVSIYEKSNGNTYISWMNTGLLGNMMGGVVGEVMAIASADSETMIRSIKK